MNRRTFLRSLSALAAAAVFGAQVSLGCVPKAPVGALTWAEIDHILERVFSQPKPRYITLVMSPEQRSRLRDFMAP